jgi:putative phage-type endonuclease
MSITNDRKDYIGGSDISAVMGLSRWKTPLQLWAEKTGAVEPEDISNKDAVKWGNRLEEVCASAFEEESGLKVRRAPQLYVSKDYPFMRCQVDRLITGTDDLLEIKTASAWKEKEWEGEEIPQEYILQVQWQLMITGRKTGYIAVLIGGQKFLWKKIEADYSIFQSMIESAVSFWKMAQEKTPPMAMPDDNSFIVELYPKGDDRMVEASQDISDAIKQLQLLKAEEIKIKEEKEKIEVKIKEAIKDLGGIKTPEYLVKWSFVRGSTFTVTKKDSRQLRVTKIEGAKK